jgi:hypothetical protein
VSLSARAVSNNVTEELYLIEHFYSGITLNPPMKKGNKFPFIHIVTGSESLLAKRLIKF